MPRDAAGTHIAARRLMVAAVVAVGLIVVAVDAAAGVRKPLHGMHGSDEKVADNSQLHEQQHEAQQQQQQLLRPQSQQRHYHASYRQPNEKTSEKQRLTDDIGHYELVNIDGDDLLQQHERVRRAPSTGRVRD